MVKQASMKNKLIILMYHGIDSCEEPSELTLAGDLIYVLNDQTVEKHFNYLKKKTCLTTLEYENNDGSGNYKQNYNKILITFDDGHISNYTKALPILMKYCLKGVFFITTDWIDTKYFMTKEMIKKLNKHGMIIGSHGKTHKYLSDLSNNEIENELLCSKNKIEDIIGEKVICFSAPGGRIDERVFNIAKKVGYSYIFDSKIEFNKRLETSRINNRIAMKRNMEFNKFAKIVKGDMPYGEIVKDKALVKIKKIIGSTNYDRIRAAILRD